MNKHLKSYLKRICCLVLALGMVISVSPQVFAEDTPTLSLPSAFMDVNEKIGTDTPFKPPHRYNTMQNPPDFTWPRIRGATKWDLIIARDEALTDIAYSAEGIPWHYYNFDHTFEPGTYYWAVRYYEGTNYSNWSTPRRFRLDPSAWEFTVPDLDGIVEAIPTSHPRIWFTSETLDEFKKKTETENGKIALDSLINSANSYINVGIPADPGPGVQTGDTYQQQLLTSAASSIGSTVGKHAQTCALTYVLTGDTKYKDYAIEVMTAVSAWDYLEGWTSFKWQDQAFFEILSRFAFAYDWLYNDMTPEQRSTIGGMLKARFDVVKDSSLETIRNLPYNSHIWSYMPNYGVCAIALMHDYPEVNNYFGEFLQLYVTNYVPMSTEDGGWSKGTAYWTYAFVRDKLLLKVLQQGGYLDMYNKAYTQNEYLWAMYMMPVNSYGSFGDESNRTRSTGNGELVQGLSELAYFTNNPVAAWARDKIGNYSTFSGNFDAILSSDSYEMEPVAPVSYPRSAMFVDQGMAAMHSDLINDNRISLYFRSGKYGSYNHMHADQNSFMIEANGERLASKGGWYDSYHSEHDSGFTRKTYAHNSITYDVGQGQIDDSMDANGHTDMFVTQADFDAVVGDATDAYVGGLDKFVRSIIYIRPDTYIVVDDLVAAGSGSNFEWWLNTVGGQSISIHDDGMGANITATKMALDARVHYPEKVTGYYSNLYSGPELVNIDPTERYSAQPKDERIWFETESVKETKMITTMNVHLKDEQAAFVKQTDGEDYVKLEFEDGTIAVVSKTSDNEKLIEAGDISFIGTAVVYNEDSIMLVGGKQLTMNGIKLIESDNVMTLVIGQGELNFSSSYDCNIKLYTGNELIPQVSGIMDSTIIQRDIREPISASLTGYGVEYGENGEITITMQNGNYAALYNGTPRPGRDAGKNIELEVVIDGVSTTYEAPAYYNNDRELAGSTMVNFPTGSYLLVDQTPTLSVSGQTLSNTVGTNLSGDVEVFVVGEKSRLELKSIEIVICETTLEPDYDGLFNSLTAHVEAEDFEANVGTGRLGQGLDWFHGISKLDNINDSMTYTINVPEDGYYDFAVRAAVWLEPLPERTITIDGKLYVFTVPMTGGWGGNGPDDFLGHRISANAYLTAGEHKLTLGVFKAGGYWNVDWIGIIKK